MKPDKKGKPPQKKGGWTTSWAKIFLVMACILFVGVMIITSLGTNWLVTLKPAKTGDTAVIDLTIRDNEGRPVFTTSHKIYNDSYQRGELVWYSNPLTVTVNATTKDTINPVTVSRYDYGLASFGLFGYELNQITSGLVGMTQGKSKTIVFPDSDLVQRNMTPEQFAGIGGNFSTVMPGDQLLLAFTTSPAINIDKNATPEYAIRTSLISAKASDNVTVSYGYPSANITLIQLSST
jgi:hypothetical protein